MQEIILNKNNRVQAIQKALEVLRVGGTIVYPTETSYGLGGDFFDAKISEKIYQIKERDKGRPLSVIVPDMIYATSLVTFSESAKRLAAEYWPGPLTLVLPYKYCEFNSHCDDYLALRVSSHPFAADLSLNFGNPLVATSANTHNSPDMYEPKSIIKQFSALKNKPDLFINAGELPKQRPSTIIKVTADNKVEILRQGDLKIKI
ncbi:threonylcarbamoyl-AMP synthase [Candidatus Parcubacteria bacterium]|nr:MAG: threonylcarbamoyl-AMP synthase [Candidatus Parcubacteria bacterium]